MLGAWLLRFSGLFNKQRREHELAAELESHLQMNIEDNLRAGMTPEEARRQSLIKLGGVEQTKENYRDRRGLPWLESFLQDVRFGLAHAAQESGFTAVAVLTLALGIGANTAIFTIIDAIILRMLAVQNPEQLVELHIVGSSFSYPGFQQMRKDNQVLSGTLAVSNLFSALRLTAAGQREEPAGQFISGNFFSVLGVQPLLGRTIIPADEDASTGRNPSVAVISYGLWQQRFGADPSAIGKEIEIEGSPFIIIGVAPPKFSGLQVGSLQDFWIPISAEPLFHSPSWLPQSSYHWLTIVGRLKPGVSAARAGSDVKLIFNQILNESAASIGNARARQLYLSQTIQTRNSR